MPAVAVVGLITGFSPVPAFWNMIGLEAVPVAVIMGMFSSNTEPAETLNVTPP